jgi:O-antigen/teichoic acid export membrane protein
VTSPVSVAGARRLLERALGSELLDRRAAAAQVSVAGTRTLSMVSSSVSLIFSKVATMGLGFIFWLAAARLFEPAQVGIAAGIVSAMMLCNQLALVGVGSAFIIEFPHEPRRSRLLDTSFTLIGISSLAAAGLFLALAAGAFSRLGVVDRPLFAAVFTVTTVLGTAGILFDQVSTSLRRGDQALTRGVLFGLSAVVFVGALGLITRAASAFAIFSAWIVGSLGMCLLGALQLRRSLCYGYRPRLELRVARRLLRVGLPNHVLTLTERAPGLILPIIVIERLSPAANAAWYAAWMMAMVVYMVPIQVGMTLFAEAAHQPAALRRLVGHGVRLSLVLGGGAALALAISARRVLSILGPHYATAGTTPLRLLVLAVVPLTLTQAYFVACRSRQRLREAIVTGLVGGTASLGGAAIVARPAGLTGIALVWLAVQALTAAWSVWRVRAVSAPAARSAPEARPRPPVAAGDPSGAS